MQILFESLRGIGTSRPSVLVKTFLYNPLYIYMCVCMYVDRYVCMFVSIPVFLCMYLDKYTYICIIFLHIHIYIYIYVFVFTYVYNPYIYTHIYIDTLCRKTQIRGSLGTLWYFHWKRGTAIGCALPCRACS